MNRISKFSRDTESKHELVLYTVFCFIINLTFIDLYYVLRSSVFQTLLLVGRLSSVWVRNGTINNFHAYAHRVCLACFQSWKLILRRIVLPYSYEATVKIDIDKSYFNLVSHRYR